VVGPALTGRFRPTQTITHQLWSRPGVIVDSTVVTRTSPWVSDMGSGWSDFRRSPAALLGAGLLLVAAEAAALAAVGVPGRELLVLVPVLACYGPVLLLLTIDLSRGPNQPTTEGLDRLVALKRRGALFPGDRPRPTRRSQRPATGRQGLGTGFVGDELDRLVAVKRSLEPGEEERRRQVEREPWSEP